MMRSFLFAFGLCNFLVPVALAHMDGCPLNEGDLWDWFIKQPLETIFKIQAMQNLGLLMFALASVAR